MLSVQTCLPLQGTTTSIPFLLREVIQSIHDHSLDGWKQLPCVLLGHNRNVLLLEVRVKISETKFVGREEVDETLDSASLERGEMTHRLVIEVRAEDEREHRQCRRSA